MTTQINIVVDDGGLIQRNKEQTDGNRWLTLEKNGQKLTARKSKEMRDQELAKQGKAPDGKPQSTAPAKPSFRRDEPAAQRMLGTEVPYYFRKYGNNNSYAVASGNASQQASGTFTVGTDFTAWAKQNRPDPITSLLPADHTYVTSYFTNVPGEGVYYRYVSVKVVSSVDEPLNLPYATIYNYKRTRVLERAVLYWFPDSGAIDDFQISMPLGKGQAADFAYRRGYTRASAAMTLQRSTEQRYMQIIENDLGIPGNTYIGYGPFVSDQLDSFEKVYDQQYTDSAQEALCFRVGEKIATAIAVPGSLQEAVDSVIPRQQAYEFDVIAEPWVFVVSDDWVGGAQNYIGYSGSISITGLTSTVTDPNYPGIDDSYSSGYGLATPPGASTDAATPLTWFVLDSDSTRDQLYNYPSIANTDHARMLNVTLSGGSTTISSVFKGKYVGLPKINNSYQPTPGSYLYGWGSPSVIPRHPSSSDGYPEYSQTQAQGNFWKARQARIPQGCALYGPGDSPSAQSWNKVLVYDWQNPAFCRQQASRYGL